MYDPVLVIESGNTYERGSIEAWLQTNMLVASCPKSCFRRFCMRLIAKHAYTHASKMQDGSYLWPAARLRRPRSQRHPPHRHPPITRVVDSHRSC